MELSTWPCLRLSIQLYVHVILRIRVSIAYWIVPYELGDMEDVTYERMKIPPKIFQKTNLGPSQLSNMGHYM